MAVRCSSDLSLRVVIEKVKASMASLPLSICVTDTESKTAGRECHSESVTLPMGLNDITNCF